jgi:hypothetical protein
VGTPASLFREKSITFHNSRRGALRLPAFVRFRSIAWSAYGKPLLVTFPASLEKVKVRQKLSRDKLLVCAAQANMRICMRSCAAQK